MIRIKLLKELKIKELFSDIIKDYIKNCRIIVVLDNEYEVIL